MLNVQVAHESGATWCVPAFWAGEGTMPYYLSETKDADRTRQRDWVLVLAA